MHGSLTRHGVQAALQRGKSQRVVADFFGLSVRSVRRIAREEAVMEADDREMIGKRGIGRPSAAGGWRDEVLACLKAEPDMMSAEVLRRLRLKGYKGGKSAMYNLVASVRPPKQQMENRFEAVPGEFSQHDFGQVDVVFVDGHTERIHFFASRLKYSRHSLVTLVATEQSEVVVRTLAEHFRKWGGIPLLAVFDRPKTIALRWRRNGEVTSWNPMFAQAMVDLGVTPELCWPHRPNQKGAVENLVKWAKNSFFKARRFVDRHDLQEQLDGWLTETNEVRANRATGDIPAVRLVAEQQRMRPCKVAPEHLALRHAVVVGPTAEVRWQNSRYQMQPEASCLPATLYLFADKVRIVAGRFDVTLPRATQPNQLVTSPEVRAKRLANVSGNRGRRYLKRQDLFEVGQEAQLFLTEVVHRRPDKWHDEVEAFHELLQIHGPEALRQAFAHALSQRVFGAEYIRHFLHQQILSLGGAP